MDFGTILYESKDRVATITLNRPERFNAISETMPEDITTAFSHAPYRHWVGPSQVAEYS